MRNNAPSIAALQKDILAISQKETPFDVFICYKESDENGKRTKDSALAQDIYYQLTDAGYKVFFARITLEDKLGQEYEPYIFAALHSAKVMVVVGTKPEYLNAVWVKNEWSRYLALMRTDRSRLLIPCYRDMDPYDMPEELSMLQSQDMGKIGFLQDLIRGVKKVVDAAKPQEAVTETVKETVVVHNEGGSNVQALLKRGNMALEDGEWTKADEFFEQVLNQDAECGAAYLGKFLARVQCRSAKVYADAYIEDVKDDAPDEKNADACEPDEAFIAACVGKYTVPGILSGEKIRQMLEFDLGYCVTSDHYALRAEEAQEAFDEDKDLMRAVKYASNEVKTITEGIRQTLDKLHADVQKREDAEKARITADYRKFLTETEAKLEEEHPQRLKEAEEARKAEADRQRKAKAAEKKIAIVAGIATAVIALVLVIVNVIIPAVNYSKAEKLLAAGDYDGAIAVYTALGDYKDASKKITQIEEQQENERLAQKAAEEEPRNAQVYADAELLLAEGKNIESAIAFGRIAGYKDARERSFKLWGVNGPTIIAGYGHTVALKTDGTVVAVGGNEYGQCDVSEWTDIVAISGGDANTVGLKADGTVVVAGDNEDGQCNVSDWTDIMAIGSGIPTVGLKTNGTVITTRDREVKVSEWTNIAEICKENGRIVGLKTDGTVVATGFNSDGQCDVSGWTDIVAIRADSYHTIGLKTDGTVVATGDNESGQCDVSDWKGIVAISTGSFRTVGLKADGTVVATGRCDVSDWKSIVAISTGSFPMVGLKADGTVTAVGMNGSGRCNVSDWKDIVAVSAGDCYTVGLKADGTVVAVGANPDGQCNVSGWADIIAVSAGENHTIGLKSDGTVVAVGDNEDGQCDVSDWTNIKLPD